MGIFVMKSHLIYFMISIIEEFIDEVDAIKQDIYVKTLDMISLFE